MYTKPQDLANMKPAAHDIRNGLTTRGTMNTSLAWRSCLLAAALLVFVGVPRVANADFFAGFNDISGVGWTESGPSALISQGWTFRNQDNPNTVAPAWTRGIWFPPQEGTGFLFSGVMNLYDVSPVSCSRWAILPDVPDVASGATVTVWAIGYAMSGNNHQIEVRLSSGGTSTGSGAGDVGDFSTLVGSITPTAIWQPYEFTLPANGRLALRYQGLNMITNGGNGAYIGVDSITVGQPAVEPACRKPIPAAGETVVWRPTDGAHKICVDTTIPEGATLVLEPGVTLEFLDFAKLRVEGQLIGAGSVSQPIELTTPESSLDVRLNSAGNGHIELHQARIGVQMATIDSSVIQVGESIFTPVGGFRGFQSRTGLIRLENCVSLGDLHLDGVAGSYKLRNVRIAHGDLRLAGFSILDGVTIEDGQLELIRDWQRAEVGKVTIDNPNGPALKLRGGADFHIGPNANLLAYGGDYPIHLQGGGLTRDSVVTGSAILGPVPNEPGSLNGHYTWPDFGIPYVMLDDPYFTVNATIDPGVTIQMGEWAGLLLYGDVLGTVGKLQGLPGAPIRFESLDPATQHAWSVGAAGGVNVFEHVVIDGAGLGVTAPQSDIDVRECVVQNCMVGIQPSGLGYITVHGTRFYDNEIGVFDDPSPIGQGISVSGAQRPNIFEGNGIAVDYHLGPNGEIADIPADNNWWGDATGPFNSIFNPGGLGDPVSVAALFQPYLVAEPDLSDTPPVVRMKRPFIVAEPGDRIVLEWDASDDQAILQQSVWLEADGGGEFNPLPIVTGLFGDTRSYLWEVPFIGSTAEARKPVLRIQATDFSGNTGFDEVSIQIPAAPHDEGTFAFTSDLSGPFTIGQEIDVCWQGIPVSYNNITVFMVLDGDDNVYRVGENFGSCMSAQLRLPLVSTDTARIGLRVEAGGNQVQWYFSDEFEIRPHAAIGDAPPAVVLTNPNGPVALDGNVVPIEWSANDDHGVRDFRIQISCNNGRTWNTIARDLPADATSYTWQPPIGDGFTQTLVRVVAFDTQFQNSSSVSGESTAIPGDINNDGVVGILDRTVFVRVALGADSDPVHVLRSDVNHDGDVDGRDIQMFMELLLGQ